ncbi:hypothetical protein IU427_27515 [Nocardia beijingensis]|uniref:type VII secretion target n=1 Tax=Nocardia beijingensis TaxID=95162 RepID=UPI0018947EDF|nr:type VII secretion target [Nocardia beijingensis]MBF6468884.1 hypothetical protein [Nocardia beijingensis]
MPNYLDVEPDQLRRMAKQHDQLAADIRKWGEIPHDWLSEFEPTYGVIAEPMRAALVDYYNRRHESAERLAANHERTRDELLAAADALEKADHSGGQQIGKAGDFGNGALWGGPTLGGPLDTPKPVDAGADTPITNDTPSKQPSVSQPTASEMPELSEHLGSAPLPPAASAPQINDTVPPGLTAPNGMIPPMTGIPQPGFDTVVESSPADISVDSFVGANGAYVPTDAHSEPGIAGEMPAPVMAGPSPAAGFGSGAGPTGRPPTPLPVGPFAAAVHTVADRRALPPLVVGERVEDDLALARNLLAATLSAVTDSAPGTDWGVAVGRTPVGPVVMLTSTEGRGWLPPGLFLPEEVVIPWKWKSLFKSGRRDALNALEGIGDPARILAEFGRSVTRRKPIRISALVSSAPIPEGLRAALGGDVAVEGLVSARESAVDLTSPGEGLVDRLGLAGSDELMGQAALVPDGEIRAKCLEVARTADAWVSNSAMSGVAAGFSNRAHRQRILDALDAGLPIPPSWWDQFRAADGMAQAALRSRRVDVSHIPLGDVPLEVYGTEAVRRMTFERRADELLLLLAGGEPDRQTLRDVLYSYGQIAEHPLLPETAPVVAARTAEAVGASRAVSSVASGRGAHGVGISDLTEAPPSVAELLRGSAESEGSSMQRRV